jgi:histone-lysine N-methyltransferase SETMAR
LHADGCIEANIFSLQVLRRDLIRAVKKKRPVKDGKFFLHHDNATPHTSSVTRSVLAERGIGTIAHPPYSPDLAPCDFWLFPTIKRDLRGHRFDDVEDLPVVVRECVRRIPSGDFKNCFNSWVHRHQKCVKYVGEYFEKN